MKMKNKFIFKIKSFKFSENKRNPLNEYENIFFKNKQTENKQQKDDISNEKLNENDKETQKEHKFNKSMKNSIQLDTKLLNEDLKLFKLKPEFTLIELKSRYLALGLYY